MKLTPAAEVAALIARIERRRAAHQSTAADERDLIRAKARQLRAEMRARKSNRRKAA